MNDALKVENSMVAHNASNQFAGQNDREKL
jgi:hypothetical protein